MRLKTTILDILFPKRCVACKRMGDFVCSNCFARISFDARTICPLCNKPSFTGKTHETCVTKYGMNGLLPCVVYAGVIKKLVYQFKYQPYLSGLVETIANLMTENLSQNELFFQLMQSLPLVLPVPLSSQRLKQRGYNHASLLASHVAQYFSLPFQEDILLRVRDTRPQFRLSRSERFENIQGAFVVSEKKKTVIKNRTIILIDDIATSCSTLRECAKTLKRNGGHEVWGIVFAREN